MEEKFFENLAKSRKIRAADPEPEEPAEEIAEPEEGAPEAELARAVPAKDKSAKKPDFKNEPMELVSSGSEPEGQLTIDVYQTPDEIVVESAIAGIRPEDIDVDVTSDSVSIRGERRKEQEVKEEDYFYQECYWGRFSRSVILPQEIDPDHASVNFKNGILTVRLPNLVRQKSKKLKVRFD